MPVSLPNLYTSPSDVYDWLGSNGVDLLLDDDNEATGQKIQATADAAVGATQIQVENLTYPLLNGSVLQFGGSGMAAQTAVQLTAVAQKGATLLSVAPLAAQVNNLSSAQDSGVNLIAASRLAKGCKYGTSQVKLYCCTRYDDSQLALAWSCNRWATTLAARWICRRRRQSSPKSIEADAAEALEELRAVHSGSLSIEDIGTRTAGWPYMSNLNTDVRYELGRVRVISPLSEGTPTTYAQLIDWSSIFWINGYY